MKGSASGLRLGFEAHPLISTPAYGSMRDMITLDDNYDEENGVGNGLLLLTLAGVTAQGAIYLDGYQMNVLIGNLGGTFLFLRPRNLTGEKPNTRHADLLREGCRNLSGQRAVLFDGTLL
ncbi:MAG: hypothetical protein A2W03_06215 [Candidatus Aminicenantes bacterium RBG_16_63_16]|nr:MAG: hypothetical protein A2W03_06215 [Candidatus Aminicenantes bacterium RBG_16_63_16]